MSFPHVIHVYILTNKNLNIMHNKIEQNKHRILHEKHKTKENIWVCLLFNKLNVFNVNERMVHVTYMKSYFFWIIFEAY